MSQVKTGNMKDKNKFDTRGNGKTGESAKKATGDDWLASELQDQRAQVKQSIKHAVRFHSRRR